MRTGPLGVSGWRGEESQHRWPRSSRCRHAQSNASREGGLRERGWVVPTRAKCGLKLLGPEGGKLGGVWRRWLSGGTPCTLPSVGAAVLSSGPQPLSGCCLLHSCRLGLCHSTSRCLWSQSRCLQERWAHTASALPAACCEGTELPRPSGLRAVPCQARGTALQL